jgi:DNA polymerase-4/DNA polymerase V
MQILTHHSFPHAILHVDGDSFFASCEVAKNPTLRGKCVVTGKERGIASSMSYEAKARGVTRAMRLSEIRKICPDVIILPSDYETYSLYSQRMYEIVRRYTNDIEEYSIDECFADLTGMRRPNNMSYEEMAAKVKYDLDTELGMTFSVGLSVNKVTAKIGSKWKKPSGLTIIPGYNLHLYLSKWPVGKIWGIGPNTESYLQKQGINTSLDFATKTPEWVKSHLSKPFQEIHAELNGRFIFPLTIGEKHDYASISKTKTFTPPSTDKEFIFSQLSKNIENACIKMRRHHLFTKRVTFFLKTQDFHYHALELKLAQEVCVPEKIIGAVREVWNTIYHSGEQYRASGITLSELSHENVSTIDMFGQSQVIESVQKIHEAVDKLGERYGKHSVFLGSSFRAMNDASHRGARGELTERRANLLKGETRRRRIGIPFLGKV